MSVLDLTGGGGPSVPEELPPGTPPRQRPPTRRWGLVAVAVVAVLLLVTTGLVVATRDDGDQQVGTGTGTSAVSTTAAPTTTAPATTGPPTSQGAPTTVPIDTSVAVYPDAGAAVRYDEPVAAARGFAVDFLGFVDPVVGDFWAGDSQSGEVEIRPSESGPVTTTIVRRLGDAWWVLGAATPNIDLREPAAFATISSPVSLEGVSTAFEATVSVEIRQDGRRSPLGEGYVMGGSMGELGRFDGRVAFPDATASMGAVVLFTESMENGNLWEASVVRVRFAPVSSVVPASACPDYSMAKPEAALDQMVVTVFFMCDAGGEPVPTYRVAPATPRVLRAALEALLAGPRPVETEAGLESWFSSATATVSTASWSARARLSSISTTCARSSPMRARVRERASCWPSSMRRSSSSPRSDPSSTASRVIAQPSTSGSSSVAASPVSVSTTDAGAVSLDDLQGAGDVHAPHCTFSRAVRVGSRSKVWKMQETVSRRRRESSLRPCQLVAGDGHVPSRSGHPGHRSR